LEQALIAKRDEKRPAWQDARQERICVRHGTGIGGRHVCLAKILDAGLEELVRAVPSLAEHFAKIPIAARRAGLGRYMVKAHGNGELGAEAQRFAGLALGKKDAAAQVLSRHVEEWV